MPRRALLLALALVPLVSQGCNHNASKPAAAQPAQAADATPTKTTTLQHSGKDVLRFTVPTEAACTLADGSLDVKSREGYVNVWLIPGAKSVAEGVQRAPTEITSEFKDFKPTRTTSMTLSGTGHADSAATRMMGAGFEADDDDPGTADVIVFAKGGHIFIACTHGESMRSSAQNLMVRMVQSASVP